MPERINRGYKGILISLQGTTCSIPFNSVPLCVPARDNRYLTMRVVAGEARREYTSFPVRVDTPSYATVAEITDDEIKGDADESACDELFRISDFLSAAVSKCYGASETHTHLFFALTDMGYILLDDSSITTVSETSAPSLTETLNDAIKRELENFPATHSVCCTNSGDCGPPKYKISKLTVVLYRMDQQFPTVGERVLYRMVKNRIRDPREETVCCLRCYHMYVASDRIFQCAQRPEPLAFELPPRVFQPLVSTELNKLGKRPLVATVEAARDPHRYVLNLVESPYAGTPEMIGAPPKPVKRPHPPRIAVPAWATRLSQPVGLRVEQKRRIRMSAGNYEVAPPIPPAPVFEPAVTHSQGLAPRLYGVTPFNIEMLDPKRKAKIRDEEAPVDRLAAFYA